MAANDPHKTPGSEASERASDQDVPRGVVPDPHADEPAPRMDPHTRPAPDANVARPDQDEELGPVPELFTAAGAEAAAYVSDDPAVRARALEYGAEAEGLETAQIFGLLVATVVALILAVIGVFVLTSVVVQREEAARLAEIRYPELQEIRARDAARLQQYGTADDGTFRIPLQRARQLLAAEHALAAPADAPQRRNAFNMANKRAVSPFLVPVQPLHAISPFGAPERGAEPAVEVRDEPLAEPEPAPGAPASERAAAGGTTNGAPEAPTNDAPAANGAPVGSDEPVN